MELLKLLASTDLFGGLSESSKKLLADIALPKELEKGAYLFHEGHKGYALYLLGRGSIQLTKAGPDARTVVVKTVQPGELFGEVILFEQDRYPVTAAAAKKSIVYLLPKHQFHCLLDHQRFRLEFLGLLMAKQRYLTERIRDLQSLDVEKRFFHYLREHFGDREHIVPGIAKKELAAAIGAAPETFSRLLLRLKKKGAATWEGDRITLAHGFWDRFEKESGS